MLESLKIRLRQGQRTIGFPDEAPELPDRFCGRPLVDRAKCPPDCARCIDACPTAAIQPAAGGGLRFDLGRCLFCSDCLEACPAGAIRHDTDYRLAARRREDLLVQNEDTMARAAALDAHCRRLFGRSLRLRQVSAGGCNACEADVAVLGTIVFDMGRFGIQFVASPRHADGLLVTGPTPQNMRLALEKAYAAVPSPRLVIAVGACAVSGGVFAGHPEVVGGADSVVPVDLYIPGCPPHPITILDGLLSLLGRLPL